MIEFQRRAPLADTLSVAPLIDIIFLLLLFFLLTSVFMDPGIPVELFESTTAEIQAEQMELVISVSKAGTVFVNNTVVSDDELPAALAVLLKRKTGQSITLRVDQDAPFSLFARVMDAAKQAGGEDLIISAESLQ